MRYHLCASLLSRAETSASEKHSPALSGETRPVLITPRAFVGPLRTVLRGRPLPLSAKRGLSVQGNAVRLSIIALTDWIIQEVKPAVKRSFAAFFKVFAGLELLFGAGEREKCDIIAAVQTGDLLRASLPLERRDRGIGPTFSLRFGN